MGMPARKTRKRTRTPADARRFEFEVEVRAASVEARAGYLRWLRRWRVRPGRVFWVVDGVGEWRRL